MEEAPLKVLRVEESIKDWGRAIDSPTVNFSSPNAAAEDVSNAIIPGDVCVSVGAVDYGCSLSWKV